MFVALLSFVYAFEMPRRRTLEAAERDRARKRQKRAEQSAEDRERTNERRRERYAQGRARCKHQRYGSIPMRGDEI